MKIFVITSLLLLGRASYSQDSHVTRTANNSFQNGHNLSVTSDVLPQGHCVLGLDIMGCGLTDSVSLGSSTWMYTDYNMYSIALKGLISEDAERNRWAFQVDYFKTFGQREYNETPAGVNIYQMEALWLMLIRTFYYNDHYRLHVNFHANYYFDETMPFSLRRPYIQKTPFQFNFGLLHEVDLVAGWFVLGEMALLDMARSPLHIHAGASIGRMYQHFSFHVGFSITGSKESLFSPIYRSDYQQYLRSYSQNGYRDDLEPSQVKYDFALHPEFSLLYEF